MSLSDDVDALLLAILGREQERQGKGEPQCYFESADLAAALGWTPERLNRAVELLERRALVEVDESLGSAPYLTHGLFPTAEGLLACEKLRGQPQPAQPAGTMPESSMPRDPAEQRALDVVADYLEATAVWIDGRALRSKMKGSVEENNAIISRLVPALLVRDGQYPNDRYRLTLEGALESRHGFLGRGDMSAFRRRTGSGSSWVIRRYQGGAGEAGDLGRARHQPQRPTSKPRFRSCSPFECRRTFGCTCRPHQKDCRGRRPRGASTRRGHRNARNRNRPGR